MWNHSQTFFIAKCQKGKMIQKTGDGFRVGRIGFSQPQQAEVKREA
jgi:hypothetical protein